MPLNNLKWVKLINYISQHFGEGQELDLQAVLFLIGVNELGQGYRSFQKNEKIDLLHIAICKLLSRYGYYTFVGRDADGWPHWKSNEKMPKMKPNQQTALLKEGAIKYFEDSKINFSNHN
tara:strand:+ start:248 stop:607 length:360 start_codon:yes stop_codon:yes gene_type:complete